MWRNFQESPGDGASGLVACEPCWLLSVVYATTLTCVANLVELLAEGDDCFFDSGGGHGSWTFFLPCCCLESRSHGDHSAPISGDEHASWCACDNRLAILDLLAECDEAQGGSVEFDSRSSS